MTDNTCVILKQRGVIAIEGGDARDFLQGIVTCDVNKVSPTTTTYGAFLTPQGKYLFDFFMAELNGVLLLDVEKSRIGDFIKQLSLYKLRAQITLRDVSDQYVISALFGATHSEAGAGSTQTTGALQSGLIYTDPRLREAGRRTITPLDDPSITSDCNAPEHVYEQHRLALGLPHSMLDLIVGKSLLLENGFDELNAIDWQKGCYMGQEVTARTKHRGLVKKRLVCVHIDGAIPEPGSRIMAGDSDAGEMRSALDNQGLALIKLEYFRQCLETGSTLNAGGTTLTPRKPAWAIF